MRRENISEQKLDLNVALQATDAMQYRTEENALWDIKQNFKNLVSTYQVSYGCLSAFLFVVFHIATYQSMREEGLNSGFYLGCNQHIKLPTVEYGEFPLKEESLVNVSLFIISFFPLGFAVRAGKSLAEAWNNPSGMSQNCKLACKGILQLLGSIITTFPLIYFNLDEYPGNISRKYMFNSYQYEGNHRACWTAKEEIVPPAEYINTATRLSFIWNFIFVAIAVVAFYKGTEIGKQIGEIFTKRATRLQGSRGAAAPNVVPEPQNADNDHKDQDIELAERAPLLRP